MIDWLDLAANSLWIMGCTAALATLSYAIWMASMRQKMLHTILAEYQYQIALNLSGILFCLGLVATSEEVWEILIWLLLGFMFAAQVVIAILKNRKKGFLAILYG